MKFVDSKRQLPEERVPCPWDTTRSPKDRSRETPKRMKKDVINYHAGKIVNVLMFNCHVSKSRDKELRMSETYKNNAGHSSHARDA